jgi:Uma2 family endonuclease
MASATTRNERRRKRPVRRASASPDKLPFDVALDEDDDLLPPPIPFSEIDQPWDSEELPYDDGRPMDSEWQFLEIPLLIDSARYFFREQPDVYCGGNMFIYYGHPRRKRRCHGPDFFMVRGAAPAPPRKSWIQWKEGGRLPNILIELLSHSTRVADLTIKKDIYERAMRLPEYFCYEPQTKELIGWRLIDKRFTPLEANVEGRLWSEELGLWVGAWNGVYQRVDATWLRFFTRQGHLVLTHAEAERERADAADKARSRKGQ